MPEAKSALLIQPSTRLEATPGDVNAVIEGGQLLLPVGVYMAFRAYDVRNATDLLSYFRAFPSAVMHLLRWEAEDVVRAFGTLKEQLREHVDERFMNMLESPPPPRPGMGALPPPGYKGPVPRNE